MSIVYHVLEIITNITGNGICSVAVEKYMVAGQTPNIAGLVGLAGECQAPI